MLLAIDCGNTNFVFAVFDGDEERILTWSLDGNARLWDEDTGKPVGFIMKHGGWIEDAVIDQ